MQAEAKSRGGVETAFMPKPKELTDPAYEEYRRELDQALHKQNTAEKALETLLTGRPGAADESLRILEPGLEPRDTPRDAKARTIINTLKAEAAETAAATLTRMREKGLAKEAVTLIGEHMDLLPTAWVDERPYLQATVNGRRTLVDSTVTYRQTPETRLHTYITALKDHAENLRQQATVEKPSI